LIVHRIVVIEFVATGFVLVVLSAAHERALKSNLLPALEAFMSRLAIKFAL